MLLGTIASAAEIFPVPAVESDGLVGEDDVDEIRDDVVHSSQDEQC
jgi:hypothetical protein